MQSLLSMPALPVSCCAFLKFCSALIQMEQTDTELIVKFDKALCFLIGGAVFF